MTRTTLPPTAGSRRLVLFALLSAALSARDDALRAGFAVNVGPDGIDTWVGVPGPATDALPVSNDDAKRIAEQWQLASTRLADFLDVTLDEVTTLTTLRASIPASYAEALIAWHFQQREYEEALTSRAHARSAYAALEDAMGRVRRECGRKIQAAHMETSDKPIADTPLDKQAGDHPDYVQHRADMAAAKEVAEHWDARVAQLVGRVDIARVVAEGFTRGLAPQQDPARAASEGATAHFTQSA